MQGQREQRHPRTFPVGAPRLVQVRMHINHAWADNRITIVQQTQHRVLGHRGGEGLDAARTHGDCSKPRGHMHSHCPWSHIDSVRDMSC